MVFKKKFEKHQNCVDKFYSSIIFKWNDIINFKLKIIIKLYTVLKIQNPTHCHYIYKENNEILFQLFIEKGILVVFCKLLKLFNQLYHFY